MTADYHIHTKMCGHATGEMEEYVVRALEKGLDEIGFSDHIPMYFLPMAERDASIAMKEEELPLYVEKVRMIQKKFAPFKVKLGIEADFAPGMEQTLKNMIEPYDFDYILGSTHFIDGWGFDNPDLVHEYEHKNLDELYVKYFMLVEQTAQSGLFDIIAHPDLIKKFGFRPKKNLDALYEKTVKTIAESNVCVEVNTAGLRVPAEEIYPTFRFLELCRKYNVGVTLGSDAHCPGQVGWGFDKAVQLIKNAGYDQVVFFTEKTKKYQKI